MLCLSSRTWNEHAMFYVCVFIKTLWEGCTLQHGHTLKFVKAIVVCTPNPTRTHLPPQPCVPPCQPYAPSFHSRARPLSPVRALPLPVHAPPCRAHPLRAHSTSVCALPLAVHAPSLPCAPPLHPYMPPRQLFAPPSLVVRAPFAPIRAPPVSRARPPPLPCAPPSHAVRAPLHTLACPPPPRQSFTPPSLPCVPFPCSAHPFVSCPHLPPCHARPSMPFVPSPPPYVPRRFSSKHVVEIHLTFAYAMSAYSINEGLNVKTNLGM
jgi:hypothetical protein